MRARKYWFCKMKEENPHGYWEVLLKWWQVSIFRFIEKDHVNKTGKKPETR